MVDLPAFRRVFWCMVALNVLLLVGVFRLF